ncbi:MAG: ATP-binding protein [Clostridia bacterium]|nr:ATP-binding protein [Clostridia bacterium]
MKNFREYEVTDFLQEEFDKNTNQTESITTLELVDMHSIMKASQIISQEIILDELIKKLIEIIIENVGAQKVIFMMKEADKFVIKGQKEVEERKINIVENESLESYDNIPKSIVNYVIRTGKSVILEDCTHSNKFISDEYIFERKPKSVLCFPLINKKELNGIIYLENNFIAGAFSNDKLKALEILSSQMVISLKNAKLYKDLDCSNKILDIKVKECTLQLKQERDKLQRYLDIAEVLFILIDIEGKITLVNRKACEISGYNEEEIKGKMWYDFLSTKKEREKSKEDFKKFQSGKILEYVDRSIITKAGEIRVISCHKKIIRHENGNIEGLLVCGLDMTEQKELKEALEYSKLKLEFFANLSHELKTPLNLCFSALQMINLYRNDIRDVQINKKLDGFANIIKQNNYRLLKLVNNIIDITKINSDSYDLHFQNYDIVKLIREITYSVKDYVENKNRILKFNSKFESKIITCDPFTLERIILNLLSNAIKFTDEGDMISVNLSEKQNAIFIEVVDSGIGISEDNQKIIFERFRQVDKSFTRNNEGSGIGLTIVKLLVELLGGKISVESTSNIYTKFKIQLPVSKMEEKSMIKNNYNNGENLIDRLNIEFSDVYGL